MCTSEENILEGSALFSICEHKHELRAYILSSIVCARVWTDVTRIATKQSHWISLCVAMFPAELIRSDYRAEKRFSFLIMLAVHGQTNIEIATWDLTNEFRRKRWT